MKIYKYDVPNKLIMQYCKVIMALEKGFTSHLERERCDIHDEIFEYVGCYRSLWRQEDREFNTALNKVVLELTYEV